VANIRVFDLSYSKKSSMRVIGPARLGNELLEHDVCTFFHIITCPALSGGRVGHTLEFLEALDDL